jgi:hypothetical protein
MNAEDKLTCVDHQRLLFDYQSLKMLPMIMIVCGLIKSSRSSKKFSAQKQHLRSPQLKKSSRIIGNSQNCAINLVNLQIRTSKRICR